MAIAHTYVHLAHSPTTSTTKHNAPPATSAAQNVHFQTSFVWDALTIIYSTAAPAMPTTHVPQAITSTVARTHARSATSHARHAQSLAPTAPVVSKDHYSTISAHSYVHPQCTPLISPKRSLCVCRVCLLVCSAWVHQYV